MKETVTVVIPAYNEERNIGRIVDRIREAHPGFEVLVVDDGSRDGTAGAARDAGARVVSHPYNMGNGAAVKTGIRNASGEVIVLMDGDGQHDPSDIPRLLGRMEGYAMVVGSRGRGSQASWARSLGNAIYCRMASYVAGTRIPDLTSGFRAMRRKEARRFLSLLPNTFSYPSTLTLCFLRAGYPVAFEEIRVGARKGGSSKIRLLDDGMRFLLIIIKIATLYSPLRIFIPVSLLFFGTGILYYLYTYLAFHRLTNMAVFLLSTSVIIFMMGIVSEQVSQLYFERSAGEAEDR